MSYVLLYDQQDFLQDGGVSKSFTHNMTASLRVLPTKWLYVSFAYKMTSFLVLPTRRRRESFAYKMAAMPRF